ncbi:AAA family ATPase [Angustibacter peucedani]
MLRVTDVEAAVQAAVRLVGARPPHAGLTRVLAVDGPSGAGKSTLAQRISVALEGAPVVRLDDVYPGWDGLDDGVARLVEGVLEPLAHGRPARLRRYDWVLEQDGEEYDVPAAPVVVLEGCGAGAGTCRPYLSALVWVDAVEQQRFDRAIARDGDGYRSHWRQWADQERAHFDREGTAGRADITLCTTR